MYLCLLHIWDENDCSRVVSIIRVLSFNFLNIRIVKLTMRWFQKNVDPFILWFWFGCARWKIEAQIIACISLFSRNYTCAIFSWGRSWTERCLQFRINSTYWVEVVWKLSIWNSGMFESVEMKIMHVKWKWWSVVSHMLFIFVLHSSVQSKAFDDFCSLSS